MTREEAIKILSNHEMIDVMWDKTDEALNMAIDALEQEPCEDCISRKVVLDLVEDMTDQFGNKHRVVTEGMISLLPPATPKPKTGHWKKLNVGYGCSECSLATNKSGVDFYRFCPNCGAKMESEG